MRTSSLIQVPVSVYGRLRAADAGLMAAAVAFNTFFALVPTAIVVVASISSFVSREEALDRAIEVIEPVTPADVQNFIRDLVRDVEGTISGGRVWVIVAGMAVALYAGSRAMMGMQRALARLEGMREHRSRWRIRLVGVLLMLAAGVALLASLLLLVVGGSFADFLRETTGVDQLATMWQIIRIPMAFIGMVLFLRILYQWGPPQPLPAIWLASFVGTAGVVLASLGFGWYLSWADQLGATFGVLGAVAVALAWLFLGAMAALIGAALVTSAYRWREARDTAEMPSNVRILRPEEDSRVSEA